jgi:4-amino-4-deoxy-L-arabinose transferase-like glycosyltransferase
VAEPASSSFIERRGAIVLFFLALILLFPGSNILPLLDRDEPRFARATVEMMDRDEWVVPYFNNEYRFDKPVLTYWLMRAGYWIFGVGEIGARFHSIVSAAALAVVIFSTGRRWLNAKAGFLAGLGMLTCLQTAIHGRSAVADMPMVLFVCVAMSALWELLQKFSWSWFCLFYASLGFGFLAKGPIALIVPMLAALLWRFVFWRRPASWRNLKMGFGLPITLAIIGAWGIPALVKTEGLFWKIGMGEHVVDRGMKAFNGRRPLPFFYCFTVFVSLFPWCFFARDVWRVARGKIEGGRTPLDAFLVAWFIAPVLVFSFYSTQLMHYIMPGFPAFFLLLGRAWAARDEAGRGRSERRMWAVAAAAAIFSIVLVLSLAVVLRPRTPAIGLQRFLRALPAKTTFGFFRFREPSLVFYAGRPFVTLQTEEKARDFFSLPGPRVIVVEVSAEKIFSVHQDDGFPSKLFPMPTNGCEAVSVSGVNVAQGKYVTIRAIFKP